MSYCNLCNSLTIAKLFPPNIFYHAKNLAALERSSQTCSLCTMLYRCVVAAEGHRSEYNPQPISEQTEAPLLKGTIDDQLACDESGTCDDDRACEESSRCDERRTSDNFSIKLQIIEETPRRSSSTNLDGFTHIGIWIRSRRMLSSLTLVVQEGMFQR